MDRKINTPPETVKSLKLITILETAGLPNHFYEVYSVINYTSIKLGNLQLTNQKRNGQKQGSRDRDMLPFILYGQVD